MQNNFTIPRGSNSYCGPAVLAYITRTDPDTAAAHFRRWSRKKAIRGVSNELMLFVIKQLGLKPTFALPAAMRKPTLKQWWLSTEPDGLYVINITGHFIVLDGARVYDNTFREGKAFHVCPYLQRKVRAVWRIER